MIPQSSRKRYTDIDSMSFDIVEANRSIDNNSRQFADMQCTLNDLIIALHDSINSPKGVVPKSADKFYIQEYYGENNT